MLRLKRLKDDDLTPALGIPFVRNRTRRFRLITLKLSSLGTSRLSSGYQYSSQLTAVQFGPGGIRGAMTASLIFSPFQATMQSGTITPEIKQLRNNAIKYTSYISSPGPWRLGGLSSPEPWRLGGLISREFKQKSKKSRFSKIIKIPIPRNSTQFHQISRNLT